MSTIQLLDAPGVTIAEVKLHVPTYEPGCYLKEYDPEVGLSSLVCTMDQAEALDTERAFHLWRSVPSDHPVRTTDGRPNRPLSAFTVEIA